MQPETAVDYTQRNHDPAVPQVEVRPDLSAAKLHEPQVVDETKDGLEEKCHVHHEADDGVVVDSADIHLDGSRTDKQVCLLPWECRMDWGFNSPDCPRQRGCAPRAPTRRHDKRRR